MKRKKLFSIFVVTGIILCSTVMIFAQKQLALEEESNSQNLSLEYSREEEKIVRRMDKDKPLRNKLSEKGYYADDINISMDKYIEASVMYDMTDKENEYIMTLFEKGYDFEKLIDIYNFLKNTSTDISALEEIYDIGKVNFDNPNWIENAYDAYIGDGRFEITTEEVFNYVKSGISVQEIMRCYEVSLSLNKPLREILDERTLGKEWSEIFIPNITKSVHVDKPDIDSVARVIKISRYINRNADEIAEVKDNRFGINEEAEKEFKSKKTKTKSLKNKMNIVSVNDKTILEEAKKHIKNFNEKEIKEMLDEGYRIKDIKDASQDAKSYKAQEIRHRITDGRRKNK